MAVLNFNPATGTFIAPGTFAATTGGKSVASRQKRTMVGGSVGLGKGPVPTTGVKAGPYKGPLTYGPPGGLNGLNGNPNYPNRQPSKAELDAAYAAFHPDPGPAGQDYDALFRQSLDRQRTAIDAQLRQVMGDIGARHTQADQIVAMQPGEVNALYDQAAPKLDKTASDAKATMAAAGASAPGAAQDAGVGAIRAAIETNRAGALADQPYLKIGENDLYSRQAGAAQQAALEAKGAVDSQLTDYYGQRAGAQFAAQMQSQQVDPKIAAAQQEKEGLQAATPAGTAKWWQAHALVDPTGANKMAANYNLNPDTLKQWQQHPDLWQQAKGMLTPDLVSFLKFQYGLK